MDNYLSRAEYRYGDDSLLVLSHGTVNAPDGRKGLLLDIDVIKEESEPICRDEALTLAAALHSREREAFEQLVTNKARGLFDAG